MVGFPLLGGYNSKEATLGGVLLTSVQEEELALLLGFIIILFRGGYASNFLFLLGGRRAKSIITGANTGF